MSTSEDYQTVLQNESDPYLTHILQLHAPMSHEMYGLPDDKPMCLACQVMWPCKTFSIFKDRFTNLTH